MRHSKLHIIGGPGSGKTYVSKKLSKEYEYPVFDLDEIFWDKTKKDYVRTTDEYKKQELNKILENESWIIEGVYYKWLSNLFKETDLIIVLKTPLYLRQWRIFKRFVIRKFNRSHHKQETLISFLEMALWNHKYDKDNLVRFLKFTANHAGKTVFCSNYSDIKAVINNA